MEKVESSWSRVKFMSILDAALFWRAATVVRDRRDVANDRKIETNGLQCAHRRFTSRAGTSHEDFYFFQSVTHRLTRGILRDHLRCVSRAFARAFETNFARARPADDIAIQIGDRDDGVVKRGENVRNASVNILAPFRLDDFRLLNVVGI